MQWVTALIVVLISVGVRAQAPVDEAMFGLNWRMTVDDVKANGVSLTKVSGTGNIETYKTDSLPRNISDGEEYRLIFSDGALVKLIAIGRNITGDPTGRRGKERFEALHRGLVEKYGTQGKLFQRTGSKLYRGADEFYECLRYAGCGMWVSTFETPTKDIALEVKGLARGTGYIVITVESVPDWSDALKKQRGTRDKSDRDAL